MAPRWADSSFKHGIPRADQAWLLVHPTYSHPLVKTEEEALWVYIGNPHPQTEREVEILVWVFNDGREALVFHAMELGSKYRRFREEHPND
jgi:hypothetical protein